MATKKFELETKIFGLVVASRLLNATLKNTMRVFRPEHPKWDQIHGLCRTP